MIIEFKEEELVEREIEIAEYLLQHFSLKMISLRTGLGEEILIAHLRNMMKKLNAADMKELIKRITTKI
ncbi:MAG: LuxR C-terminal-related transcriptional regulator [Ferruginibacter sp.]